MPDNKEPTAAEIDKKLQDEARKKSEAKTKLVDEIVAKLRAEFNKTGDLVGLQVILKEVADKVAGIQVIAAGAQYGPKETDLKDHKFPVVASPMADGTPVANIAQVPKPGDKSEAPKENVPTQGKQTAPSAPAPISAAPKKL